MSKQRQARPAYSTLSDCTELVLMAVGLALLFLLIAPGTAFSAQITGCDRLAALPEDLDKPSDVPGVKFDDIDPNQAEPACRAVLADSPDDLRAQFELARVLDRAKNIGQAKEGYERAANDGYQAAMISRANLAIHELDREASAVWLEKAQARGGYRFGNAASDLGILYENDKAGSPIYQIEDFAVAHRSLRKTPTTITVHLSPTRAKISASARHSS